MLVHMSVIHVANISHFELSVCFCRLKKVSPVLCVIFDFLVFEKMDQRNCINISEKKKLNVQGHLKC